MSDTDSDLIDCQICGRYCDEESVSPHTCEGYYFYEFPKEITWPPFNLIKKYCSEMVILCDKCEEDEEEHLAWFQEYNARCPNCAELSSLCSNCGLYVLKTNFLEVQRRICAGCFVNEKKH